jgi:hypothetical protein
MAKKDPDADVRNRGDCVFPSGSKYVDDDKDHFPINDKDQARNALARVAQYDSKPNWATGISLSEIKKKVKNAVKNKYPDIEVSSQESKKVISFDEKFTTTLKESDVDLEKGQAKITAIEQGWSNNGFYYTESALRDIVKLLGNKGKLFVDHVSSKSTKHGRTLFEWAATVNSVMLEENKVKAVIDFTNNPKTKWLKEEAMKHPEEIQFSINARGKAKAGTKEGKDGYIVESVKILKSVDLVDYAAAGGELESFRASVINDLQEAEWSTQYINNLPDGAFAVIEPAYVEGETDDKRARHLPHHTQEAASEDEGAYATESGRVRDDSDATVDMSHLRNALARVGQIEPVTDSISTSDLREIAREHLKKHRDLLDTEQDNKESIQYRIDDLEAQLKEAVSVIKNLKDKQNKEVDTMKLSEMKNEHPELLEQYRAEIKSEIEDEVIEDYKESQKIVEKMEEKEEKINELESELEDVKESKKELEEKVSNFEMREAINDRKAKVQDLLENSKLNVSLNKLPESVQNNLLDLDKDDKEVKEAISDLEEFATNDSIISGHGESNPDDTKKNNDNDNDETDLTENDDEALSVLKS